MITIKDLSKTFETKAGQVEALKNINLTIEDGDIYGIIGMSGAGKSTLVRTINMLERPTSGQVVINDTDIGSLSDKELRSYRRKVTMIFQGFNLLMQRNCLKNVCFPLELAGVPKDEARQKALKLLELVELKDKAKAYPAQLSGGQQQRVAIARALATDPDILLCDEATSALDPKTTNSILDLIRDINKKLGITVIVITHQMSVVENICNKVAILENGSIVEEGTVEEVFANPKSDAGRRLVYPDFNEETIGENVLDSNTHILRVVFNESDTATEPIIAKLAKETGIEANIIYASTKSINNKAHGSMLLTFKTADELNEAIKFLSPVSGITIQEVTKNV
ncbi:MAG: ATP-binding cassette domain-containing protein [Saccharofermentans sp.]|nr:ATP-binding cassette domain-containing protein [Saccharofermentans sp.]